MKGRIFLILIFAGLIFSGCEKQKFDFVLDLNQVITYHVDQNGAFELASAISRNDVLQLVDIGADAEIKDVRIQTLAISTTVAEGNAADKVKLTLFYKDLQTGREKVFENYQVPITGLMGISNSFSPVSLLLDRGVNKIRNKIRSYLESNDYFDYEIILNGDTQGKRLVADVRIKIVATVEYSECMEVLKPFSDGESCGSGEPGI
ncbi:MAG: hypothetical protein GXO74_02695 [Calditrichaeota bacterium]|nr:hypothetical protein [Calditrichota bacterium]